MRRFSTPTHEFHAPFPTSLVSKAVLTYEQDGKIVLEKTEEDLTTGDYFWSIKLTQEETGSFAPGVASAEIHFLNADGTSGHIGPALIYVEDAQHKEALK